MDDDVADTVATYETIAAEYEERHGDRSDIAHLVEPFLSQVTDGGRVLDVGCGPGWETATFRDAGHDAVALDLTAAFCRTTRERVRDAGVLRGDMRRLPVATDAVDGCWACASFLHVPRAAADATLAEFARVCRPGATLCLSVKAGDGTFVPDAYEDDERQFTLWGDDELRERVEAAGFSITDLTVHGRWVQLFAER